MQQQGQSYAGWRTNPTARLPGSAVVHAFPLHQIYLDQHGKFLQTRSGPNWQGGVLTLATCKHYMRLATDPQAWRGRWVAAFTPKATTGGSYLLALARVSMAFPSNYAMGTWLKRHVLRAYLDKLMTTDPRGDVCAPKRTLTAATEHCADNYITPVGHVRMELKKGVPKWRSDVEYTRRGLYPACLLFDSVHLYDKPTYEAVRPLHRSGWKCNGVEFMEYVRRVGK